MFIGADPEVFLQDAQGGLVSAIDKIGGSKENPRPLDDLGEGFAVQEDNVALEYNIPPANSAEMFVDHIQMAMKYLQMEVARYGLQFNTQSAAFWPKEQLLHPKALEFGCDPDFNAWDNGRRNPRPKADDHTLRSCGGHIHVGHRFKTQKDVLAFIRRMDLFLAVPSVILDEGDLRKQLYGKAGAFRFKPYGCEYRVLSNFWIFDPQLIKWVYQNTEMALEEQDFVIDGDKELILQAINKNDKRAAEQLIQKHDIPLYA